MFSFKKRITNTENSHSMDDELIDELENLSEKESLSFGERMGVVSYRTKVEMFKTVALPTLRRGKTWEGLREYSDAFIGDNGEIGPHTRDVITRTLIALDDSTEFTRGVRLAEATHNNVLNRRNMRQKSR